MTQVVPPRFLFRWSFAMPRVAELPRRMGRLLNLTERCRLPSLSELDSTRDFADIRVAWNAHGIGVSISVSNRTRKLLCSADSLRDSDGLTVWIDTRNTQGVHRATRFCHQFCLLPASAGSGDSNPIAVQVPMARAREESSLADVSLIKLQSEVTTSGYWLDAWFPSGVLIGYDPATFAKLGFHYIVRDRELGVQTLAVGTDFPVDIDPSLWQTLELVDV